MFLLRYCAQHHMDVNKNTVPNASPDFARWFCQTHGEKEEWEAAGYPFERQDA